MGTASENARMRRRAKRAGARLAGALAALALVPFMQLGAAEKAHGHASGALRQTSLYVDGPSGRYLLNGSWLLRKDPADRGVRRHWFSSVAASGWRHVTVPNAWNAGDNSVRSA